MGLLHNIGAYRLELKRLLHGRGPRPLMMTPDEQAAFDALPDTLTVYVAAVSTIFAGPRGPWTLTLPPASRFLNRYRVDYPLLVTARVRKANAVALKLERNEREIITFAARRIAIASLPEGSA